MLDGLNEQQRLGAETTEGPVLVIAGAGSGKTKMLTSRIVNLMANHNVHGHHILAVTFTNKAAEEMRNRISLALGLDPASMRPNPFYQNSNLDYAIPASAHFTQPMIGTFHSVCSRILRREIDRTPFTKQFVIYDDSDQLTLVKDCFSKLGINDKSFSPKSFQWAINTAKCNAQEPQDMQADSFDYFTKNMVKVYALYQQELFKNNALDFGEMITLTYRLLRDNKDLLEKYQNLYRYIHVDEYQDTNRAQYLLVNLLASKHQNICVVGDEDQSIYSWRGADIKNILDFEKDYPDAKVIKLEQNYRSTQTIIKASSNLISFNSARKPKTLWTDNEKGTLIKRFQVSDERAEAELIAGSIKHACESQGFAFTDIALFYRTNAQSRIFEDIFRRERIPYLIVGGLRFYDRKEIKDVMAYFRVLVNPEDSVSFRRIINVPARGIGKTTVDRVEELGFRDGLTFEQAIKNAIAGDEFTAAPKKKLAEFLMLLGDLRKLMTEKSLEEFYHELMDRTGYVNELKTEGTEESLARIENLQELNSILQEFGHSELMCDQTLPVFLENVALVGEKASEESVTGSVSMMTLHTSKGLEFPLVFMVGMEEGLFPSIREDDATSEEVELEEERRLCYVGMTRAEKELVMTHAVCRRIYGNIIYNEPARFFNEIPAELMEYKDLARFNRYSSLQSDNEENTMWSEPVRSQRLPGTNGFSLGSSNSPVGKRVRHQIYGEGVIKGFEGNPTSQDSKVTIEFAGRMTKKFILKFANLEYL